MKSSYIILLTAVATFFAIMAPAMAATETSSQGQFIVGNKAPSVDQFEFRVSDGSSTTTEFAPTNEYWLYITISDDNTIDDIKEITVKLFYDTDNTQVGTPPAQADSKNYVILHYSRTPGSGNSGSWEFVDENGNSLGSSFGSWQITGSEDPSDWTQLSGVFKVKFKVGKVAHEANTGGGDDWDCIVTAIDDNGDSGSNNAFGYTMDWYGEISADDTSFNFGSVNLGATDVPIQTPSDQNIDLTAISNGDYKIQVKAADTSGANDYWVGQNYGDHAVIVTTDPGAGEMRLKVDDDSDHSTGVMAIPPQSSGYADWLTGLTGPTDETGTKHYAYLLLDLGSTGLQDDTYVGNVYFQIANS